MPLGELFNVPLLPNHFLPRGNAFNILKQELLNASQQMVMITGKPVQDGSKISIQGMGGIGKSVLASALVRDVTVRQAYRDGVFWISLGQTPDLLSLQTSLAIDLGDVKSDFTDVVKAKITLRRLLKDKRCLLVLDDIWDLAHYNAAFDVLDDQCRLLITTRDLGIANLMSTSTGYQYSLEELSKDQALELLRKWVNLESLPKMASNVAEECGYLPLALAMVGAYLRDKPHRWKHILTKLKTADLEKHKISKQLLPGYQYELFRAIQVSLEALDEVGDLSVSEVQQRYCDLAIFPEGIPIPESVLKIFWKPLGLGEDLTEELLDELVEKSLLRRDDLLGRLTLHDLQHDYICKRVVNDLSTLHQRFLDAYELGEWLALPESESYLWRHLAHHLVEAGRQVELRKLLLNRKWLDAKLAITSVSELISDFDYFRDDLAIQSLQKAIQLSGHLLLREPSAMWSYLYERLLHVKSPTIQFFLQHPPETLWLRIFRTSLKETFGLIPLIGKRTKKVNCLSLLAEENLALSGADDGNIILWNISSQSAKALPNEHDSAVLDCSISINQQQAVQAVTCDAKGKVVIWQMDETPQPLKIIEDSHYIVPEIMCCALSPDGQTVAYGRADGMFKFVAIGENGLNASFEFSEPRMVQSVSATGEWRKEPALFYPATTATFLPSGDRIFLFSRFLGKCEVRSIYQFTHQQFYGSFDQYSRFECSKLSCNGKYIIAGTDTGKLCIFDINKKIETLVLDAHSGAVTDCDLSHDGQLAVSIGIDNQVKVWNLKQGHEITAHRSTFHSIKRCAIGDTENQLLFGTVDGLVCKAGSSLSTTHRHKVRISCLALSPSHSTLISVDDNSSVTRWSLEQGIYAIESQKLDTEICSCSIQHNDTHSVFGCADGSVIVWNHQTNCQKIIGSHEMPVGVSAYVGKTDRFLTGDDNGIVIEWDITTGEKIQSIKAQNTAILGLIVPKKEYIVTTSCSNLEIHELEGGQTIWSLSLLDGKVPWVSPEGDLIAVWGNEALCIMDIILLEPIARLHLGPSPPVECIFMSENALCVVTDYAVSIWDLLSEKILTSYTTESLITCATVNGLTISLGMSNGNVKVFCIENFAEQFQIGKKKSIHVLKDALRHLLQESKHSKAWTVAREHIPIIIRSKPHLKDWLPEFKDLWNVTISNLLDRTDLSLADLWQTKKYREKYLISQSMPCAFTNFLFPALFDMFNSNPRKKND